MDRYARPCIVVVFCAVIIVCIGGIIGGVAVGVILLRSVVAAAIFAAGSVAIILMAQNFLPELFESSNETLDGDGVDLSVGEDDDLLHDIIHSSDPSDAFDMPRPKDGSRLGGGISLSNEGYRGAGEQRSEPGYQTPKEGRNVSSASASHPQPLLSNIKPSLQTDAGMVDPSRSSEQTEAQDNTGSLTFNSKSTAQDMAQALRTMIERNE